MPEHGGKRTPGNPAPVSGPGQLSQRTDGGPQQTLSDVSGLAYGENQGLEDLQSAAPMSASGQTTARATRRAPSGRGGAKGGMGPTPLMAPTQRPDEPVTAGAPFGPGSTPSGPAFDQEYDEDLQMLKSYLPDLEAALSFEGTPKTFRYLVNYLRNA